MKNWIYFLIAFLLAIDNVFVSKRIGFLSVDRLLEIIIFLYFFKSFLIDFKTHTYFRKFTQFILLFFALKLLMNIRFLVLGVIEPLDMIRDAFKILTFIVYAYLFFILLKKGYQFVRVITWVHLIIIVFSLLHHPLSPISSSVQQVKKVIVTSNDSSISHSDAGSEDIYIKHGIANRFRLSGPFAYSIPFSYFAISCFLLSFFLFINTKKKFYLLVLALLFIAAFLSQTRSLILSVLFVTGGFIALKQQVSANYRVNFFFISLLSMLTLIIAINSIKIESRVTKAEETGGQSDSRPLLWATGILAVLENPLGVSDEKYQEAKQYMYQKYGGGESLLELTAHNGLINVGFEYSFFGYILFGFFYIFIFKRTSYLPFNYKLFFRLSLIAYLIHTSFHNNFILYADYPFLMILVLLGFESQKTINHQENKELILN